MKEKIQKFISVVAVTSLLLPNIVNVGVASAQELTDEEPEVEELLLDEAADDKEVKDVEDSEESVQLEEEDTESEEVYDEIVEEENLEDVEEPIQLMQTDEPASQVEEKHILTIDPNGGTINEDYRVTEVEEGEEYTLPYAYKSELFKKGYSLEGYTVEGTLLNSKGEQVTEIEEYRANYTLGSDVKLTAQWKVTTGNFALVLYDKTAEKDKYELDFTKIENDEQVDLPFTFVNPGQRMKWERKDLPYGHYKISIDGFKITKVDLRGWQYDKMPEPVVHEDGTATVYLEFVEGYPANHATLDIFGEPIPETNTVTIDPNGGTINEDYRVTEVEEGEEYTLPYAYKSELFKKGYSLEGYTVEGTLLNSKGEEVTEIDRFTAEYTPMSNVKLTAQWKVTTGDFTLVLKDDSVVEDKYTVDFTDADTGETVDLPFRAITPGSRVSWQNKDLPYGYYNISIDGFNIERVDLRGWEYDKMPEPVVHEDGTATVYLEFVEGYPANHATLDVFGEQIPEEKTYPLGIEVRDLEDTRTDEVGVEVNDANGEVFTGSYNEYKQWFTDEELSEGLYTITLDTPSGTYAQINDTVPSQNAQATDELNIFTIELNEENQGSLSAVFGAFQLVEEEVETYTLGVEVRDLDNVRTDQVSVEVTNADDEVFTGTYNQYKQWYTDDELSEGTYMITLITPEGTIAEINNTIATQQHAVATDEDNVFTIEVNDENKGSLSAVYGAFKLVENDEPTPKPEETYEDFEKVEDLDFETERRENPNLPKGEERVVQEGKKGVRTIIERVYYLDGEEVRREVVSDEITSKVVNEIIEFGTKVEEEDKGEDKEDKEKDKESDEKDADEKIEEKDDESLPKTGVIGAPISLAVAMIFTGLGLFEIDKKRKQK